MIEEAPVRRSEVRGEIARRIAQARRRLGHLDGMVAARRFAPALCVALGASAAARPWVWPLTDAMPWKAVLRALLFALVGGGIVAGGILLRAWRARPSLLGSARRVDEALGLAEVVASGFAFERDRRVDEAAMMAVERARRALAHVAIGRLLETPRGSRSRAESRWLVAGVAVAVLGLGVGAIDRIVIERALVPVTQREASAATGLKRAATEAAASTQNGPKEAQDPKAASVIDAARRASTAAERGDRRRALDALEEMRKAARSLEADEREQARALRSLRDGLDRSSSPGEKGAEAGERPSATASAALAQLKRELEATGGAKEPLAKLVERLERAESAARSASESAKRSGERAAGEPAASGRAESARSEREAAWARAAGALKEARDAAARGDAKGAKRAMERAEREISALEKSREASRSSSIARMSDEASELDRSLHAAMSGGSSGDKDKDADGRDGKPGGKDGASSGASRHASKDKAGEPGGPPGVGPGGSERTDGSEARRVKLTGDLQARADVREGERAVSAIDGVGRGGDPHAYREIFPSYETVVEDGLREDSVPAARRPAVRRYFSSIRPGADEPRE